jgi:hypothetical protein
MNAYEAGVAWRNMRLRLRDGDVPSPDEVADLLDCARFDPPQDLLALAAGMLRGDVSQKRGRKRAGIGRLMWQTVFAARVYALPEKERAAACRAGAASPELCDRWRHPRGDDPQHDARRLLWEWYGRDPDTFLALLHDVHPDDARHALP